MSGGYFVTICTHKKYCLFGEVVDGKEILNEIGRIVLYCWNEIPNHFKNVQTDELLI